MSYLSFYSQYIFTASQPNASNEVSCLCPFHNDSKPSFYFNDLSGYWYCHACEAKGNAPSFLMRLKGISYAEAERIVAEAVGNPVLPSSEDIQAWHEQLNDAVTVQVYLEERGLYNPGLLQTYEVGYDGERLTLPIRDEKGELLNVRRFRLPGAKGDKVLNWSGFGKARLWPLEQLQLSDTIILCAGEWDCLSAILQGHAAITGTGGESYWDDNWTAHFAGKHVIVAYDGDATGRVEGQRVAEKLAVVAASVSILNLPDGADINSLHQEGVLITQLLADLKEIEIERPTITSGSELYQLMLDEARQPWLVENLIRPGWLGVLAGHPKARKTTLATHLMRCLQLGIPFLEHQTSQVPSLYLSYEMSVLDLGLLFQDVFTNESVEQWPRSILNPPFPLTLEWLEELLKDMEPGLCVIDSARGAFGLTSEQENQSGVIGPYLRGLQRIARNTRWTILVLHHARKPLHFNDDSPPSSPFDIAGSGEWLAAPDLLMVLTKYEKKPWVLVMDGRIPQHDPMEMYVERTELRPVVTVSAPRQDLKRQADVIAQIFTWSEPLTIQEISLRTGIHKDVVRDIVLNDARFTSVDSDLANLNEQRWMLKGREHVADSIA